MFDKGIILLLKIRSNPRWKAFFTANKGQAMKIMWHLILLLLILTSPAYGKTFSSKDDVRSQFTAGPYILDVTTESAVVAFHLKEPLPAKVQIIDTEKKIEFASKGVSKYHFIKITGLTPSSTYRYEVICGTGEIRTPESDPE